MSDRGKNTTPNTIQYWNGRSWQQPMEIPNIYVNATTGSDTNTGLTIGDPLETLTAALRLNRFSLVKPTIHLAAGDYDCDAMREQNVGLHGYRIHGDEYIALTGDLTISAFDATARTITVSPDPGWSTNLWEGAFLQWVSGPVPVIPEARNKTIIASGSNTIKTNYSIFNTAGSSQGMGVGNIVRVVKPAARLIDIPVVAPVARELAPFVGGTLTAMSNNDWLQEGCCELQNVEFPAVEDAVKKTIFSGSWLWNGVRFITPYNRLWQIDVVGFLNAGCNYENGNQSRAGWMVSYLCDDAFRNPELRVSNGTAAVMLCGGRFEASNSVIYLQGGSVRDAGNTYPHGSVNAINNSHIYTFVSATGERLLIGSDTPAHDLVAEQSSLIDIAIVVTHEGTGGLMRVRQGSTGRLRQVIVNPGSDANLVAEYQSNIRIDGPGTTYGDAHAGASIALGRVTRPAGAWAIGDAVCTFANFPKDMSNIYRAL